LALTFVFHSVYPLFNNKKLTFPRLNMTMTYTTQNHQPPSSLSARQALKHPYFREMYKNEAANNQEDGDKGIQKKGFAPFKPQRRSRKREKQVKQSISKPDEEVRGPPSKSLQQPSSDKVKQLGASPDKGDVKGGAVGGSVKSTNQRSLTNKKETVLAPSSNQNAAPSVSHKSGARRKEKPRNRDRDREERRKRRERRDREERRERREKVSLAEAGGSAGSQVLPPISKAAHGKKTIQSLKIDMASKHRSLGQHRHHDGRSHRMPGHRGNSHYGYGHTSSKTYHNTGSTHGKKYHKMKYYSNVADGSSKRVVKPHRNASNRHSNRGYVGHGHHSSNNSSHSIAPSGGNYHRTKQNKAMFGLPSNSSARQSGNHAKVPKAAHAGQAGQAGQAGGGGQYGRFGYQFNNSSSSNNANNRRGNQSGRYESPYSQRKMR
jgi:hypothetical protein